MSSFDRFITNAFHHEGLYSIKILHIDERRTIIRTFDSTGSMIENPCKLQGYIGKHLLPPAVIEAITNYLRTL